MHDYIGLLLFQVDNRVQVVVSENFLASGGVAEATPSEDKLFAAN
jgi:hypothetical protein